MNIGKAVKHFRTEKGMSQLALGLAIDLDASYISRVENNKKEPNLKTILKIAHSLEVPPLVFLEKVIEVEE